MGAIITVDMDEKQRLDAAIMWLNSVREFKDVLKELQAREKQAICSATARCHSINHGELAWLSGYASGVSEILEFLKGD
ncbi:MAG: hypothetical protein LLG40_06785 [Deltaproteobacteria bacterium]|nr:hypothetical protein [Deltaproteobacteria bacterium]